MGCVNNKYISLFVGWLNIVLSFSIPIGLILLYIYKDVKDDLPSLIYDEDFQMILMYLAGGFIPWLIASILLVKGIRQNRHKLMAPWVYLSSILVIITCPAILYIYLRMSRFTGTWQKGLYYASPYAVQLVVLILCLIPVRRLYKELSNPPPVVPTQCSMQAVEPEPKDHKQYMPIFDN